VSKIRVLLLTNRDSDNVGDQLIEGSVISIIKAVMRDLGFADDEFEISSRAAGIVSRAYIASRKPELLAPARKAVSEADVIVFGGAPLFNYSYQNFYLRTIKTLELADEYGVPVIMSSIGVEPHDASNAKSLALQKALRSGSVRQITTRDDIDSVRKYAEGTDIVVAHVADPAVFADVVFGDPFPAATVEGQKKRIGLVVTRPGIFKDNGLVFTEEDQRRFWLDVIADLTAKGLDYHLFTTGHFSDEAFLEMFVRENTIPAAKATVTVNSPEELLKALVACDGIIAYRLHASIASFAYGIPSIGLSWNFKVPEFYASVGYRERALELECWTAAEVVPALERAMAEGVTKDSAFLMSVYETLFHGLKAIVRPESGAALRSYDDFRNALPHYPGTSQKEYEDKVRRKLRRMYQSYQKQYRHQTRVVETRGVVSRYARAVARRARRVLNRGK